VFSFSLFLLSFVIFVIYCVYTNMVSQRVSQFIGLRHSKDERQRVWRAVISEFVATSFFVFFACGSTVVVPGSVIAAQNLVAGLVQGLCIAALVAAVANTSGGHINPAITSSLIIAGHMPLLDGLAYIFAQIAGGITGAAILRGVLNHVISGSGHYGSTVVANGVSPFQGYIFEFMATSLLIFTVFGTAVDRDAQGNIKSLAPLPIGFAITAGVTVLYGFTGGSLNPARSFGPALITGTWHEHYIYWVGPLTAAIFVALFFRTILATKPPADGNDPEQGQQQGSNKQGGAQNSGPNGIASR